jgi:DivIVA domain-containing protein
MTFASGDPLDLDRPGPGAFPRVRWREGYAPRQVDDFLDRAAQDLGSGTPTLRPEDVRAARFTPVWLRSGYDMREVDSYLDDLEQRLVARQPGASYEPEPPPAPTRANPVQLWVNRVRWAVLVVAVVVVVCADVLR